MPCPAQLNATRACLNPGCGLGACLPGFGNCNGIPNDGCETDLSMDSFHCGACNVACGGGEACIGGQCCLPPPQGSYLMTCVGCGACNGVLQCLCEDSVQVLHPTSIPVGACPGGFANCNGVLQCDPC